MPRSRPVVSSNQRFVAEFSKDISILSDRDALLAVKFIDSTLMFDVNGKPKALCTELAKIIKAAKPHLAAEVDAFVEQCSVAC